MGVECLCSNHNDNLTVAKTTLTTKIASLVAAFGVAFGVVKVLDETTLNHEPARASTADDGRESGMALSNPFGKTNRPIYEADRASTNAWVIAAFPKEGNLDHITAPIPQISEENRRKAESIYKNFLRDKDDPSVEKSRLADNLQSILYALQDPRNMTLIGGNPVQFLKDTRTYSALAAEETRIKIESGRMDPVEKLHLFEKMEDYRYGALVKDDGFYDSNPELNASIQKEISDGLTNIAHDVIRFAGQKLITMGDPSTLTKPEMIGYIRCFTALQRIERTDGIGSASELFGQYGLTADVVEQLRSKKEVLIRAMYPDPFDPNATIKQPSSPTPS